KEGLGILVDWAAEKGIVLGLENRVNYHEIPSLEEMEYFLTAFEGRPIGYWHDLGHAEIQDRLGFCSHNEWLSWFSSRMIGVHLHDVRGIDDHYAPGTGDLDWDLLARSIPGHALKVCELANWNAPENVAEAVTFLKNKGIVRDATRE
ncbi:MAG: TIM barrel protein, partial [Deltaproteobacteria bacterium]|nr:TIM barrel protein [Deltaproteobacteria bacterium]